MKAPAESSSSRPRIRSRNRPAGQRRRRQPRRDLGHAVVDARAARRPPAARSSSASRSPPAARPGAVTSTASSSPVRRPSRTTRWRRKPAPERWSYGAAPARAPTRSHACAHPLPASPGDQAGVDRQQLVPAAGHVEAERGAVGPRDQRVLQLVAVAELLLPPARSAAARSPPAGPAAPARRPPGPACAPAARRSRGPATRSRRRRRSAGTAPPRGPAPARAARRRGPRRSGA